MFFEICVTIVLMCVLYYGLQFKKHIQKWNAVSEQFTPLGPRHPVWGHLHLFSSAEDYFRLTVGLVKKTKTKMYAGWSMFLQPVFSACHPDTVKVILKSSEPKARFSNGSIYRHMMPWLGDGLLVSAGQRWERNRRLLTPAFHFDILKPYILEYNQTADILLENLEKGMKKDGNVEIYNLVSLATLDTMLRCALSYNGNVQQTRDSHPYVVAVQRLATLLFKRAMSPWFFIDFVYFKTAQGREFTKLCNYVHVFADEIITSRKHALTKQPDSLTKRRLDFLDILLTAKDESGEGLSSTEIRAEVDTFLFEGHDTTASAISWAIYALGKYPNEQEKVYTETKEFFKDKTYMEWDDVHNASRLTAFLKEVMRMYTTIPLVNRWLTKPLVFDGKEIPANCTINVNIEAVHHHPDVWSDHEVFRSDRFLDGSIDDRDPYSYIPFSAGSRNCIGQHFALNEQRVTIARLLNRYKVQLVPGHNYEASPELVRRSKYGLKVILEDRE